MSWLQKLLPPRIKRTPGERRTPVPEGLWVKCPSCEAVLYRTDLENNLHVCPKCGHHARVPARERIEQLLDPEGRFEIGSEVVPVDSLKFKDQKKYPDRLAAALEDTGETDALVVMQGSVKSVPLVLAAFEFGFMGGSMGSVVGERFVRGVRVAYENRVPFVCVSASGGARMQEGVNSLFQMAKTTAVLQELNKARLPFVSILTDPTMGGVSASFAFVADVVIAEPGALIGFAGPRVIEQTVREKLPEGFQRAEFLMEKGALDLIVDRRQLRDELARLLALLARQPAPAILEPAAVRSALPRFPAGSPTSRRCTRRRSRSASIACARCTRVSRPESAAPSSPSPAPTARARRARCWSRSCAAPATASACTRRRTSSRYNERVRIDGTRCDRRRADRGVRCGRGRAHRDVRDGRRAGRAHVFRVRHARRAVAVRAREARRARPRGRARRPARRRQRRRSRRRGADQRRHRPRRLPRPDARGHRPREGRHLPRRPPGGLRAIRRRRRASSPHAQAIGAPLLRDRPRLRLRRTRARSGAIRGPRGERFGLPLPALRGAYQLANAATVLAVARPAARRACP